MAFCGRRWRPSQPAFFHSLFVGSLRPALFGEQSGVWAGTNVATTITFHTTDVQQLLVVLCLSFLLLLLAALSLRKRVDDGRK